MQVQFPAGSRWFNTSYFKTIICKIKKIFWMFNRTNAKVNIRSKALACLYGHEPVTNQVEWPDELKRILCFLTNCVEGSTLDGGTWFDRYSSASWLEIMAICNCTNHMESWIIGNLKLQLLSQFCLFSLLWFLQIGKTHHWSHAERRLFVERLPDSLDLSCWEIPPDFPFPFLPHLEAWARTVPMST